MIFLASMARSGSTLLASLLGQREDTFVSKTSTLSDNLGILTNAYEENPATKASSESLEELYRTLKAVLDVKYIDRNESVIIDKGRVWADPKTIVTMRKVLGEEPKIIATVRPIAECIASFYLIDKSNLTPNQWMKSSPLYEYFVKTYEALKDGYKEYPENFCIIEYSDLCNHTQRELDRVADFIGIPHVTFSPEIQQVNENDNAWGIQDLHTLESTIEETKLDTFKILGEDLFHLFKGGEFWNDDPEPIRGDRPLDLSLKAGLCGAFEKGEQILREIIRKNPDNDRAKFNLGFYELKHGNHLRGLTLLEHGRKENCWGDGKPATRRPVWDGKSTGTVLLILEGGFGDQIHATKYVRDIVEKGCKVILVGSPELECILHDIEGVSAYVHYDAHYNVHHDFWLTGMSAPLALDFEYSDLNGKPYIKKLKESGDKIGVRWSGNPEFEHQQHRLFNRKKMWSVVEGFKCISLQKEGYGPPPWMEKVSLGTWKDTQWAISDCSLVVTSCTAVAHLSAAMGVDTWIAVPILPYYLWAMPGETSKHYDSVRLFRQTKYDEWDEPFSEMRKSLYKRTWTNGETTRQFIEA